MSRRLAAVPNPGKRTALYVRVSAVMGREDLHSPDLQLKAMRDHARRQGLRETHVVQDIDVSGRTFSRSGIEQLRALARAGDVDVVAVYNLSRLGRNTAESLRFIKELRDLGISIVSTVEQIDDSPEGQFMLTQFLSMAQLYSDQMGRQWADTATHIARMGYFHGKVPLGYVRVPPRAVELDPATAPVVRRIFELYDSGWSCAQIARDVAPLLGVTTRPTTVREVLRNPAYIGKVRLRDEVYDGEHEPLVDVRLFERVQKRLGRPSPPSRTVQAAHPLAGLIRCGRPGCGLILQRKPGRTRDGQRRVALVCQGQDLGSCAGIGAPNELDVHRAVIEDIIATAKRLRDDKDAREQRRIAQASIRTQEQEIRKQLAKVERSLRTLTMALANERLTEHAYADAAAELEEQRSRLLADLAYAEESTMAPVTITVTIAKRIEAGWPHWESEEQNRVLKTYLRAVYLCAGERGQEMRDRVQLEWL
jgi:DNA invertase Pin-like site-specific DNA recombinase